MSDSKKRPAYSTNPAAALRCPRCQSYPCRCPTPRSLPPAQQTVSVGQERKGRRGKTVTVARGFQLTPDDLRELGRQLQKACGSGGTVKDGTIEIQGEQRERVAAELERLGYKVKRVGG